MTNSSFGYPVIVAKGVATDKHVADLLPLEFGVFDKKTNSVATAAGNGKEFYLAFGSPHTKDQLTKFYSGMRAPKKSESFLGKEVVSFQKAYPQRPKNEEWVLGYSGSSDDNSLVFECGKNYEFKVKLFGEPAFQRFNKTVERIISYQTPCCGDDCNAPCDGTKLDVKEHTRKLAEAINNDVELRELKIHAQPVFSDFSATVANAWFYELTVSDNGDADALFAVQRAYAYGKDISRKSYVNGKSTYIVGPRTSAPANFTPSSPVLLSNCGTCPDGYTLSTAYDTWIVRRVVAQGTDLDDNTAKATYAAAVVTAYSGVGGSGVFLGLDGAVAVVKINIAAGTAVAPVANTSDVVEKIASVPAVCTPDAGATPIAWVEAEAGYTTTRYLTVTVGKLDCSEAVDTVVGDIEASLAHVPSFVVGSATDITPVGDACTKKFRITQTSQFMKDKCESPDVAVYDVLPSFQGYVWTPASTEGVYDASIKAGIRISAPFYSVQFGDCSFTPDEYYDAEPLRMEISIWNQNLNNCLIGSDPKGRKVVDPVYRRLYGEFVVRHYIRGSQYFKFMNWEEENRIREIIDNTALSTVPRNKYYVAYFLKYKAYKGAENFDKEGEFFESVIYVEEGDKATQVALENAIQAVTSKFGVSLEDRF